MNSRPITTIIKGAIAILFAGVAVTNVLLIRENKKLWADLNRRQSANELQPGAAVPTLAGVTIDGAPASVTYSSDRRKTVLFIFSNECSVCKANWPVWSDLTKQIDTGHYRVIYANISDSLTQSYLAEHDLLSNEVLVLARVDAGSIAAYKMSVTPEVVLISPGGEVDKVWVGKLKEKDFSTMQVALGLRP